MVTKDGFAVGLVAGGYENASTDLLLPLDRPLRALQSVQSGQSIRRGTIQGIWTLEKPAECRARGLSEHIIHKHSPDGSGLLMVNKILPEGPSDGKVKEGDVLLEVNGRNVTSLTEFEDFIDNAIEDDIKIRVQRSQNSLEFELSVQNFSKSHRVGCSNSLAPHCRTFVFKPLCCITSPSKASFFLAPQGPSV